MRTLQFQKVVNLDDLHSELLAAVPSIRPVPGSDGRSQAVLILQGDAGSVTLYVPDDADQVAITAVVEAHDPSPKLSDIQAAKIAELAAACRTALTADLVSSVLGSEHHYSFSADDQANFNGQLGIVNADPSITSLRWNTRESRDLDHTREQFIALCLEAGVRQRSYIEQFGLLEEQVKAATSLADVTAIVW